MEENKEIILMKQRINALEQLVGALRITSINHIQTREFCPHTGK